MNLSQLCQELEAIAQTGHTAGGINKVLLLEAEFSRVKTALQIERQQSQVEI
jgi:hypothetical protein